MANSLLTISVAILIIAITVYSDQKYTNRYDKVDVDAILRNERILKRYIDCLMDRGTCTPDAKLLKTLLPDALSSDCAKCTEAQKIMAGKVLGYLLQYKRKYWDELTAKYDADGAFRKRQGYEENAEDIDYSQYDN